MAEFVPGGFNPATVRLELAHGQVSVFILGVSTPQRFDWNAVVRGRAFHGELVSTPQRFDWNMMQVKVIETGEVFQPRNGSIGMNSRRCSHLT